MRKAMLAGSAAVILFCLFIAADFTLFDRHYSNHIRASHLLRRELWSIGIVQGSTPFKLAIPEKPILRARDISDTAARMVADPFAVQENGLWYLFFEIDSISTRQGEIGLATSTDTTNWVYRQIVLDEPFHLSYPCVFKWNSTYYMIPESHKAGAVRLYRAEPFPTRWAHAADIIQGAYQDPSIVRYNGRWWIFVCSGRNENMEIFYAEELTGPWHAHMNNPVILGDRTRARCGGRIRQVEGKLIRFAQDCRDRYGHRLLGFEITRLAPDNYAEQPLKENPLLEPDGSGWNAHRMHQLDIHQTASNRWIGFTDGNAH